MTGVASPPLSPTSGLGANADDMSVPVSPAYNAERQCGGASTTADSIERFHLRELELIFLSLDANLSGVVEFDEVS